MPASKRWIDFNEENVNQLPNEYGVYQFADENKEIVYIGEGKLKHNISAYLQEESSTKTNIAYFRYRENDSKRSSKQRQSILLKEYKEKHGKLPEFN